MSEETCAICKYWKSPSKPADEKGTCRRHPPTALVRANGQVMHLFTKARSDDWCGEYEVAPEAPEKKDRPKAHGFDMS